MLASVRRVLLGALGGLASGFVARMARRAASDAWVDVKVPATLDSRSRAAFLLRMRRLVVHRAELAGVVLDLESLPGGWAFAEDLAEAVGAVVAGGIQVVAVADGLDNRRLRVAAAASEVVLPSSGEVHAAGVAAELTFFGAALQAFGVEADVEAAGAYKALGEPFTRSFPSTAHREATGALVRGLGEALVAAVAAGRGLSEAAVRAVLARAPLGAEDAMQLGLIDRVAYADEVIDPEARRVPFARLAALDALEGRLLGLGVPAQVAVLHLEGGVVRTAQGRSPEIAVEEVVAALDALREDDTVRAAVLAVESPGGSALAADLIWRAVDRLAAAKPVVAAYGDVAASGGVYIAAPARKVFARASSLTGSVGVVGGKLVVGEASRRLGVHREAVGDAPHALAFTAARRFTDSERATFRDRLAQTYRAFVDRVAAGRGVSPEAIEPSCRGRVWLGADAVSAGLVDALGGLDDAVRAAASMAELPARGWRRVDRAPRPPRPWRELLAAALWQAWPLGGGARSLRWPLALKDVAAGLVDVGDAAWLVEHPGEPLVVAWGLPRPR